MRASLERRLRPVAWLASPAESYETWWCGPMSSQISHLLLSEALQSCWRRFQAIKLEAWAWIQAFEPCRPRVGAGEAQAAPPARHLAGHQQVHLGPGAAPRAPAAPPRARALGHLPGRCKPRVRPTACQAEGRGAAAQADAAALPGRGGL